MEHDDISENCSFEPISINACVWFFFFWLPMFCYLVTESSRIILKDVLDFTTMTQNYGCKSDFTLNHPFQEYRHFLCASLWKVFDSVMSRFPRFP